MRLGATLPHMGRLAGPDALVRAAQPAEALGYDTVRVADRLLYPVNPPNPYPVRPDGSLPELYKIVLDPVETLTYVAAHTRRVALGTSVLDLPSYNPVTLARRLTSFRQGGEARAGHPSGRASPQRATLTGRPEHPAAWWQSGD